jgi:hypothetical protein
MRDALAARMAAAYGPGTRNYSSIPQTPQQAFQPPAQQQQQQPQQGGGGGGATAQGVALFLQALAASHAQSNQGSMSPSYWRPLRDASTDTRLQHRTYGGGVGYVDPMGDYQEVQTYLYPATGGRDHGYQDTYHYTNGRSKNESTSEIPYFSGIQPSDYNGFIDAVLNGSLMAGTPKSYVQGRTRY